MPLINSENLALNLFGARTLYLSPDVPKHAAAPHFSLLSEQKVNEAILLKQINTLKTTYARHVEEGNLSAAHAAQNELNELLYDAALAPLSINEITPDETILFHGYNIVREGFIALPQAVLSQMYQYDKRVTTWLSMQSLADVQLFIDMYTEAIKSNPVALAAARKICPSWGS